MYRHVKTTYARVGRVSVVASSRRKVACGAGVDGANLATCEEASTVLSTFYYLLESSVRYLSSAPQTIAAGTPADYLAESGRRRVRDLLDRYGDAALAASAQQLESLTPQQQERLRKLSGR